MEDLELPTGPADSIADAWRQRRVPPVQSVRPGVWAVPMPLPGHPILYSIAYLVEAGPAGLLLVDAGYASDACWCALRDGLSAVGAQVADISAVVLTHNHPDHYGLADRIRAESGCWVALHEADGLERRSSERYAQRSEEALVLAGAPADLRAVSRQTIAAYAADADVPAADRLVADHERIDLGDLRLQVVWTPGHTMGHSCFLNERDQYLFTGDHLLPDGLTQLGNVDSTESQPLHDVLESLDRVAALGAMTGLPGHHYPMADTVARSGAVRRGFEARLDLAQAVVSRGPGSTGHEVAEHMVRPGGWAAMGGMGRRFTVIETMGLLHELTRRGRLRSRPGPPERFALFNTV